MKEYKTPQEYLDPNLEVKKREWEKQKKGQPNKKYVTKKGFYMDYDLKVSKGIPGSSNYLFYYKMPMEIIQLGHLKEKPRSQNIERWIRN